MASNTSTRAARADHYYELLSQTVTPEKLQEAAKAILEKALQGNVPAFNALCNRMIGKPANAPATEDKPKPPPLPKGVRFFEDEKDKRAENSAPRSTAGGPNPSIVAAPLNSEPRAPASGSNRIITTAPLNSEPRISASG